MRNIQKIYFGFLVMTIISFASASEIISEDDGFQLRFDRQSKQPKRTSESIKKKKEQQKQKDIDAVTKSELTGSLTNVLTAHQTKEEAMKNILQNTPLEMKQLINPLNVEILTSHGYNYPYQGYPPPQDLFMTKHGLFYKDPYILDHPLEPINNKLPIPLHQQQPQFLTAPNFFGYNFAIPQQPHISAQQIRHSPYSISLISLGNLPLRQPSIQNNIDIHSEIRRIPPNHPNIFIYPEQLSVPQQPLPFNPVDFGVPPQNSINNKPFGFSGLVLGFDRNKRSLEQNVDKE